MSSVPFRDLAGCCSAGGLLCAWGVRARVMVWDVAAEHAHLELRHVLPHSNYLMTAAMAHVPEAVGDHEAVEAAKGKVVLVAGDQGGVLTWWELQRD